MVPAPGRDPQDIRRVYVVDEQNRVWASVDEGLSRRNLAADLPALPEPASPAAAGAASAATCRMDSCWR